MSKFSNTKEENSERKTEIANITQESGEPTGDTFHHLPVLEDNDHPLVPEERQYITREIDLSGFIEEIENSETVLDVELATKVMASDVTNLLFVGGTGVGKNACSDFVFANTNWPRVRVNMGVGVTYEQLVGKFVPKAESDLETDETYARAEAITRTADRLLQTEVCEERYEAVNIAQQSIPDASSFVFKPGILYRCVENGWAFMADEINAMPPEISLPMNEVAEDKDRRSLTVVETNEQLDPHPRFLFVGTMNPPSYAGTKKMNGAFKNRFLSVKMPGLWECYDEDSNMPHPEKLILKNQTDILNNGITEEQIDSLIDLFDAIRDMQGDAIRMTRFSTRDLLKIAELTDIMALRSAVRTVVDGAADESDIEALRDVIEGQSGL